MARVFTKDLVMASGSKWGELRLDIVPGTQSIPNNTTAITYELYVQRTATSFGGYYSSNTNTATLTINGTAITVSNFTYDFSTNYKKSLKTGSMTITHDADGKKTVSASASATFSGNVPNGSGSGSLALTTIPRASSFTLSGGTETGSAVTVTITKAATAFRHRVRWRIGSGTWTTTATAADTSASVTVPHTAIPSSNSATVTIAVQTLSASGGTEIGSEQTSTRTLTVPASVIPTIGAVTATENVSDVSTKVGAFVKGKSKLNLAITGAKGAEGSTITGYKITLTGTTINASSGVSNLVTVSGNVVITGTVTDSRGRTGSKPLTINVLDYAAPTLTGLAFYRSNSAGVADPTGTYVTVKGTVTVSSLIVGTTQKNKVSYDSQHDKTGSFVSFITETPSVITKAYTNILPTFTIDKMFNFRSRAGDIFGYGGWSVGVVPSGEVTQQWGRKTTAFGKMIDNTSYNIQAGTGGIHSEGDIVYNGTEKIGITTGSSGADPNTTTSTWMLSNHANSPTSIAGGYWYITTVFYSSKGTSSNRSQIAQGYHSTQMGRVFTRACYSGTWSTWTEVSMNGHTHSASELPDKGAFSVDGSTNTVFTHSSSSTVAIPHFGTQTINVKSDNATILIQGSAVFSTNTRTSSMIIWFDGANAGGRAATNSTVPLNLTIQKVITGVSKGNHTVALRVYSQDTNTTITMPSYTTANLSAIEL